MAIFSLIFYLYSMPLDGILYAYVLYFVIVGITWVIDYTAYFRKMKTLEMQKKCIDFKIDGLPEKMTFTEQKYAELIKILFDDKQNLISKYDSALEEMTDYYTLWVHQIKTPISAMSLMLQCDGEADKSALKNELFKIDRYAELVLQYLRLESMSLDMKIERCNLDDIVNQAVKKYAPVFIYKNIAPHIENTNITVITDEKWLSFIIEQILSNALKYTPSRTIKIYVEPEKTLVIEDTGIGISSEDLPRVFERGFTGYNGRTDKKASGLGLYLCKKTADKLNHTIKIESKLGCGTRVLLNLASNNMRLE